MLEHAKQVEVTLSADQGVVADVVATAFLFDLREEILSSKEEGCIFDSCVVKSE